VSTAIAAASASALHRPSTARALASTTRLRGEFEAFTERNTDDARAFAAEFQVAVAVDGAGREWWRRWARRRATRGLGAGGGGDGAGRNDEEDDEDSGWVFFFFFFSNFFFFFFCRSTSVFVFASSYTRSLMFIYYFFKNLNFNHSM
jgi:hypothetical protein